MNYQRIFNAMSVFIIVGLVFIGCAVPVLAEPEEPEVLTAYKAPDMPTITAPDVSKAFEVEANRQKARAALDEGQAIIDKLGTVDHELERLVYVGAFYITMYAATVEQCDSASGITASGRKVTDNPTCHTVAVDPAVIPLGSYLIIEGYDGIIFRADDTGSAINGYDIDIFTTNEAESKSFNNLSGVKVWLIEEV